MAKRMSIEEAGEVILQNVKWVMCSYSRRPSRPGPWGTRQIVGFDEQYQQWVTIDDNDDA